MKPTDLRGILQYVPRFREKTFVITVDGAIVRDENFTNILLDIAVLRSLNIRVVLVHGASAQIRELAEKHHLSPANVDGTGITDGPTLELALLASNRITHEILEGLAASDQRAACTNAIIAHPLGIIHGVDQIFTGKVERVDVELLQQLLGQGIIPVVPPLGFDGDGKTYRVNSCAVAVAIAESLKAIKIIFMTVQEGIVRNGQLIRQILASDLDVILALSRNELAPEMVSKAVYAATACRNGIPRVHIINGREDEWLLTEIFSNEGIGTLVYANEYQQVRRAMKKDIRNILMLTRSSMASEELVKRSYTTIEKQISDFYIFEIDRNVVACVSLHVYPEDNIGELACLCVSPSHENQGIGRKLIQFVENKSREMGLNALVALSTQTFTYFQSKAGFQEGSLSDLPLARLEKYEQNGRKSKIMIKRFK